MELQYKIEKQLNAGFSGDEILINLTNEGYNKEEILPLLQNSSNQIKNERKSHTKSILIGFTLVFLIIMRISKYMSSGSTMGLIAILFGVVVLIFFLSRRD